MLDPKTLRPIRRIRVKQGRRLIDKLKWLEFVEGEVYANIWHSDHIVRFDPTSGDVLSWIDCSQVYPVARRRDREQVLNGIAYDSVVAKRLFITGKNWPQLFEIQVQK
ncbi:MAG: glutaminyl-peptide cyclotransferase [Pirellulaceae bacterium]